MLSGAAGFLSKISFCTRRAPIKHVGHVGERSNKRRGLPLSRLNWVFSSSILFKSVSDTLVLGFKKPITPAQIAAIATAERMSHFQRVLCNLSYRSVAQTLGCNLSDKLQSLGGTTSSSMSDSVKRRIAADDDRHVSSPNETNLDPPLDRIADVDANRNLFPHVKSVQ